MTDTSLSLTHWITAGAPLPMNEPLPLDIQVLTCTSRYEQMRVLRHWFWPIFEQHIQQ